MPNQSQHRNARLPIFLLALGMVMLLLIFSLATTVAAQDNGAGSTGTPEPTSEFDLNLQPTVAFVGPEVTEDPNQIPSLTGVGGQAVNAAVIIRSGPALIYQQIGYVRQGSWINIVGWNGWTLGRDCSTVFTNDLDMWVQVQMGEQRGWVARCVLQIRGPLTQLPIVTASGDRILQR